MMTMNFDMSAPMFGNATASSKRLEGNKIHPVVFKGTEYATSKDGKYEFFVIKFEGKDGGYFTYREFGFKDAQRTKNAFGGENPSAYETFMMLLKHLLVAVAPELLQKMTTGEIAPKFKKGPTFKEYAEFISENLAEYVGRETQIKLMINKKGEATFPSFYVGISKEGNQAYLKTNFIGNDLKFTPKETEAIQIQSVAKPTVVADNMSADDFSLGSVVSHNFEEAPAEVKSNDDDLNFDI
jgi:hypothetical protein